MNRQKYLKNIALICFSALILGTPGQSEAVTYNATYPAGKAIGPYEYLESPASEFKVLMSEQNPTIKTDTTIIKDITVTLNLAHDFSGDVIVDLIGPDTRRLNLIGYYAEPDPTDSDVYPYPGDIFKKGNMYSFSDRGTETLPAWLGGDVVPSGLYLPHANTDRAAPAMSAPALVPLYNTRFSDWTGLSVKGEWKLLVKDTSDSAFDDFEDFGGSLYGWTLDFNKMDLTNPPPEVPIPGALWLFGSAVVSIVGLRKRSRES